MVRAGDANEREQGGVAASGLIGSI